MYSFEVSYLCMFFLVLIGFVFSYNHQSIHLHIVKNCSIRIRLNNLFKELSNNLRVRRLTIFYLITYLFHSHVKCNLSRIIFNNSVFYSTERIIYVSKNIAWRRFYKNRISESPSFLVLMIPTNSFVHNVHIIVI